MKPNLLTFLLVLTAMFDMYAQTDGYFGVWQSGSTQQRWNVGNSFTEWSELTGQYDNNGLTPVDFEAYSNDLGKKYFGTWQDLGNIGWWWAYREDYNTYLDWHSEKISEGFVLVDFEFFDDGYFGIWHGGQDSQEIRRFDNIEALINFHESISNQGYNLVDFEKFEDAGRIYFMGIWSNNGLQQEVEIVETLEEWKALNDDFISNKGMYLVDFEKFRTNTLRDNFYIGVWSEGQKDQEIVVTNSLEDWSNFDDKFINSDGMRLIDFEKFEDNVVNVILPNEVIIRDGDLIAGRTYNWSNDTKYILEGNVQLEQEGRLNIEEGTLIQAKKGACLVIHETAQIFANGTKTEPIIFESIDQSFDGDKWGGVTINGLQNFNSGKLSYVSIQGGGQSDICQEGGAGLTLWNVDRRTSLSHIEIYESEKDGIKINGGTAEIAYASVTYVKEDAFDWDYGWIGNGIYWFAAYIDGQIIEGKGNSANSNGAISNPKIYNGTFVGPGCKPFEGISEPLQFKDNTGGLIANSLLTDFPGYALYIEDKTGNDDSFNQFQNRNLRFQNNIWWNIGEDKEFVGEAGTIRVDNLNSNQAEIIQEQLIIDGNIIEGLGIAARDSYSPCFAIDPRVHPLSNYERYENLSYPQEAFFSIQARGNYKGAFPYNDLWVENWTKLDGNHIVGDEAKVGFLYKGELLSPEDTIKISCQDLESLHDSLGFIQPCPPIIVQFGSSSRKGKKRRRPGSRGPEDYLAFVEEWTYSPILYSECNNLLDLTILIYDSIPPVIHPIPDQNGQLTAILEDCDEAWITDIVRETQTIEGGFESDIYTTFYAEDYSGNTSSLTIKERRSDFFFTIFPDLDGDGFGNPNLPYFSSELLDGFVFNDLDCNDTDANAFPNNPDIASFDNIESVDFDCTGNSNFDLCTGALLVPVETSYNRFNEKLYNLFGSNSSLFPILPEGCGFAKGFRDIWFKSIVPNSGGISILLEEYEDNIFEHAKNYGIEVYRNNCSELEFIDCGIGEKTLSLDINTLISGEEIYFRVIDLANDKTSNFYVSVLDLNQKAQNDYCIDAIAIDVENCTNQIYNNNKIVPVFRENLCPNQDFGKTAWFSYTIPNSDILNILIDTLIDSEFKEGIIQAFIGNCETLSQIACSTLDSTFNLLTLNNLEAGQEIFISITETKNREGNFELTICSEPSTSTTSCTDCAQDSVFITYPWLTELLDTTNCTGEKVELIDLGFIELILTRNTSGIESVYFDDGLLLCDLSSPTCENLIFDEPRTTLWECGVIGTGPSLEPNPIFTEFPWLTNLVNPNNCNQEKISVYRSGIFSFIYIENQTTNKLYFQDGTFYCIGGSNYDCIVAYQLGSPEKVWSCSGNGRSNDKILKANNLGLHEKDIDFKVFPNPVGENKNLNVVVNSPYDSQVSLELFGLQGQLIKSRYKNEFLSKGVNSFKLDISDVPKGIYFVRLRSDREDIHKKLIVAH